MTAPTNVYTCPQCQQPATPNGGTCKGTKRITWKLHDWLLTNEPKLREAWERKPWNCPDCGVTPGAIHHLFCDQEECPDCGGQAISCGADYGSRKGWYHK